MPPPRAQKPGAQHRPTWGQVDDLLWWTWLPSCPWREAKLLALSQSVLLVSGSVAAAIAAASRPCEAEATVGVKLDRTAAATAICPSFPFLSCWRPASRLGDAATAAEMARRDWDPNIPILWQLVPIQPAHIWRRQHPRGNFRSSSASWPPWSAHEISPKRPRIAHGCSAPFPRQRRSVPPAPRPQLPRSTWCWWRPLAKPHTMPRLLPVRRTRAQPVAFAIGCWHGCAFSAAGAPRRPGWAGLPVKVMVAQGSPFRRSGREHDISSFLIPLLPPWRCSTPPKLVGAQQLTLGAQTSGLSTPPSKAQRALRRTLSVCLCQLLLLLLWALCSQLVPQPWVCKAQERYGTRTQPNFCNGSLGTGSQRGLRLLCRGRPSPLLRSQSLQLSSLPPLSRVSSHPRPPRAPTGPPV